MCQILECYQKPKMKKERKYMRYICILLIAMFLASCNYNSASHDTLELTFELVETNFNTYIVKSDIISVMELEVEGYRNIMFKMDSDSEIYGGFYLDKLYSVGPVSMNNTPDDLLSISESSVFGKNLIKLSGVIGANYAKAFYLEIGEDSVSPFLEVDGNIIEVDLDEDSIMEIVVTSGTIPETSIYQYRNNSIYVANINKSIDAQAVSFDEDNKLFEVYTELKNTAYYHYNDGRLEQKR